MKKYLVYDLPTRIFHWLFALLFLTGFTIAKVIDDDSPWFNYHSLAGLTLGFLVMLRILWGFFGTQHARFSDFALNPKDLVHYFYGMLTGEKKRWAGHNPASSWAGVTMMLLALGLAVTGYLMTSGSNKETFEDVHELMADAFVIAVILHVAGIVIHTIRLREIIGLSMIDGKKADIAPEMQISSSRAGFGILLLGLVVAFGLNILKNYNGQTKSLQFFGTTLQLSENESEGSEGTQEGGNGSSEQGDDD
jgi:cytochrome b